MCDGYIVEALFLITYEESPKSILGSENTSGAASAIAR